MDLQTHEAEAASYGGKMAGQYLESIGVFSLGQLTGEQWQTFCEVMCINYHMKAASFAPCPF